MMNYENWLNSNNAWFTSFLHLLVFVSLQFLVIEANCRSSLNNGLATFSIGKEAGKTDALYQFEEDSEEWKKIGSLGTTGIYSIAIDDEHFIIYAVDGGVLGSIDPVTARFTEIGSIGNGTGLSGNITINRIYGLTFEPFEKVLYATHRRDGVLDDLLVKIDPITGKIIKQQLQDENFNIVDYTLIESSIRATIFPPPPLTETTAILYDELTTELYCLQRSFGNIALCIINKLDGRLESVLLDLSLTEMFAIGSNNSNQLYSTTLRLDNTKEPSSLFNIIGSEGAYDFVQYLSENKPEREFTGIAFLKEPEKINNCEDDISINISSPQSAVVKAKKVIYSNATIKINTTYTAKEAVNLYNWFAVESDTNFSIEIAEACP